MNPHLVLALLMLSLLAGTAAVVVLGAVWKSGRDRALGIYALFSACLLMMAARNAIVDYLSLNTGIRLSPAITLLFFYAPMPLTAFLVCLLPLLAHRLFGSPLGRAGDRIALGAMAVLALLMPSPLYAGFDAARAALGFGPAYLPVNALLLLIVLYAVAVSVLRFRSLDPSRAPYVKKALIVSVAYLPGLAYDLFFTPRPARGGSPPFLPGFFPFYLIIISTGAVVYGLRYLLSRRPVERRGEEAIRVQLLSRLEALAAEKGLSPREREVAGMALDGASNKEIARLLRISKRTADNHLYNLYLKLGIESRYELLSLLSERSAPE